MNQYILINRIKVQNANAVAGFTWGFPAITHFLGFRHNLTRKMQGTEFDEKISLSGCAVIAHEHQVHTYGSYDSYFCQNKNPGAMSFEKAKTGKNPSIIEEGKMNMIVSLLIGYEGYLGRENDFLSWLTKQCLLQRLAGGTILEIGAIKLFNIETKAKRLLLKRKLLPGFILMDRSDKLADHYEACSENNPEAELLDAWLDFAALKQQARPRGDLISKHLKKQAKNKENMNTALLQDWDEHLSKPYSGEIPDSIKKHFSGIEETKDNKELLAQWRQYRKPTDKTPADWEYLPKPSQGYLVPVMTGYKAISPVYENAKVSNTRDNETDVCFVESVHSVGEWLGVNRLITTEDFASCLWHYHYEENWYLCRQAHGDSSMMIPNATTETIDVSPSDELI